MYPLFIMSIKLNILLCNSHVYLSISKWKHEKMKAIHSPLGLNFTVAILAQPYLTAPRCRPGTKPNEHTVSCLLSSDLHVSSCSVKRNGRWKTAIDGERTCQEVLAFGGSWRRAPVSTFWSSGRFRHIFHNALDYDMLSAQAAVVLDEIHGHGFCPGGGFKNIFCFQFQVAIALHPPSTYLCNDGIQIVHCPCLGSAGNACVCLGGDVQIAVS